MAVVSRSEEIRKIHKHYKLFYVMLVVLVAVGMGIYVGAMIFRGKENLGYEMNLFTEGIGVGR